MKTFHRIVRPYRHGPTSKSFLLKHFKHAFVRAELDASLKMAHTNQLKAEVELQSNLKAMYHD